jgi:hypothetical protein
MTIFLSNIERKTRNHVFQKKLPFSEKNLIVLLEIHKDAQKPKFTIWRFFVT